MDEDFNVCVFCGSSTNVEAKYISLASQVGTAIASEKFSVVYGGSRNGMMGAVANAALESGGRVIGVLPRFLQDKEVAHAGLTELHLTDTMHERQVGMAERADAFLILPGGMGTLAEFFEILTWKQLGLHGKPIVLLNGFGYWDSLLAFEAHAAREKFLYSGDRKPFTVLENIEALKGFLPRMIYSG